MFKFDLNQVVKIAESGETGAVFGRAVYYATPLIAYLLRYRSSDGRAVEQWWSEDAIEAF